MLVCLAGAAMAQEIETTDKLDGGDPVTVRVGGEDRPVQTISGLDQMTAEEKVEALRSLDGNRMLTADPEQLESVALEFMASGPAESPPMAKIVVGQYAARNLEDPEREQVIREWGYPGSVLAWDYMSASEWREVYLGNATNGAFITVDRVADRTNTSGLRAEWIESLVGTGIVTPPQPGRRANQLAQYLRWYDSTLRDLVGAQNYEEAEDLLRREIDGLLFARESPERNARMVELRGKLAVIRETMGQ